VVITLVHDSYWFGLSQSFLTAPTFAKTLRIPYAFLMNGGVRLLTKEPYRRSTMSSRTSIVFVAVLIAVLVATGAMLGTTVAQKAPAPNPQNNLALGESEVRKLVLLMNTDNEGKISKQEFMSFMEAEFNRLDKNKDGKLDVKELTQQPTNAFHK
jgi:EF hand